MEHKNNIKQVNMDKGYLTLFTGCMYSGKTTRLVDIYHDYRNKGIQSCVINYLDDTRYHEKLLSTHDKVMIPCIKVKHIYDVFEKDTNILHTTKIFIINEGQFFDDLYDVVKLLVEKHHKRVYVCGLDGDFKRNTFGQITQLIPLCDTYEKLFAKCDSCGEKASFTKRLTHSTEQTIIGGKDMYVAVCRKCY